ncbi:MAG: ABC transporter ATP-binding protein [Bacteroidota bacterium]|nr:ABC transporter ATP-binding protein [Bacteroidota bacterium]MDP4230587.1 ABC transporter ATP-binding protein [Bacteroidota bacterium]MDP4237662.1 ABC transporter ATP-binding protein [Bacteroidota bacterium]
MESRSKPLLALQKVSKIYGEQAAAVRALNEIDLTIAAGEFVAITGPSGSGKSTALSIFGTLETPTSGQYLIEGIAVQGLLPNVLASLRNSRFGFVFQTFNLLARTSARDNVALPLVYAGMSAKDRERRSIEALAAVGLAGREDAHPNQLSGGQQQRVAIARAIANNPSVLLADEPTGNLDSKMGKEIMQILKNLNQERGITVLMVTHDASCAAYAGREVFFRDGKIWSDKPNTSRIER